MSLNAHIVDVAAKPTTIGVVGLSLFKAKRLTEAMNVLGLSFDYVSNVYASFQGIGIITINSNVRKDYSYLSSLASSSVGAVHYRVV